MSERRKYVYAALILLTLAVLIVGIIVFSYRLKPDLGAPSGFYESRISKGLLLSIDEDYVPAGAERLTLILNNVTDKSVAFGENFLIEQEYKGAWFECPFAEGRDGFTFLAHGCGPGFDTFNIDLTRLQNPLKKGNYRLLLSPHPTLDVPVLYFAVQ